MVSPQPVQHKLGVVEYMELVTKATKLVWKVYTELNSRRKKPHAAEYMHTEAWVAPV